MSATFPLAPVNGIKSSPGAPGFCFITKNWRGHPLTTYEVIVNLIASTTTKTGLTVRAALDSHQYETGISVSDDELKHLRITRAKFHGDWNYSIKPRR